MVVGREGELPVRDEYTYAMSSVHRREKRVLHVVTAWVASFFMYVYQGSAARQSVHVSLSR